MKNSDKINLFKEGIIKHKFVFGNLFFLIALIFCLLICSYSATAAPDGYCDEATTDMRFSTWITDVDYHLYPSNQNPESIKLTVELFFTTDGFGMVGSPIQPDPDCLDDYRYMNAWIDWNGDYAFDSSEQVFSEQLFWYDELYQLYYLNAYQQGDPVEYLDVLTLPRDQLSGKSIRWLTYDSFCGGMGFMSVTKTLPLPESYADDTWMKINYGWLYNPQYPCDCYSPTYEDPYNSWEYGDSTYKKISTTPDLCINTSDIVLKAKKTLSFPLYDFKESLLNVTVHNNGKTEAQNVEVLLYKTDKDQTIISSETKIIPSIAAESYATITFEGNFDPYRFEDIIVEIDHENKIWEINESNNHAQTYAIKGYISQQHLTTTHLPRTRVDIQQYDGTSYKFVLCTVTDDQGFYKFWTNSKYLMPERQTYVIATLQYMPTRQLPPVIYVMNETQFGDNVLPNNPKALTSNDKLSSEFTLKDDQDSTHNITFSGVEGGLAYQTLITLYEYHKNQNTAPSGHVVVNINDNDGDAVNDNDAYAYQSSYTIHLPPGRQGTTDPFTIGHEFTHIVQRGWLPTYYDHHPLVPVEEGSCHWGSCIARGNPVVEFDDGKGGFVTIDVSNNSHTSNSTPASTAFVACREEFQIAGTMWDLNTSLVWHILRYGYGEINPIWPCTPLLFYDAYKEVDSRTSPVIKAIFKSHAYATKTWPGKDGLDPDFFTETFFDQAIDSDGDGKYESLQIGVELDIVQPGDYLLSASIDETTLASSTIVTLDAGINLVNLSFFAENIFENRCNGPYTLSFYLYHADNYSFVDNRISFYNTSFYDYASFKHPLLVFTDNHTTSTVDEDSDGLVDQLILDVELNLTESSYVKMFAALYCNDVFIDNCWGPSMNDGAVYEYVEAGTHNLSLFFNGESIYAAKQNGSYEVRTSLGNARSLQVGSFDYIDFEQPSAVLSGLQDEVLFDKDMNGYIDSLNLTIGVLGQGSFIITGHLYNESGEHLVTTHVFDDINTTQSLCLCFDGESLRNQRRSGVYNLSVELYDCDGFFLGYANYVLSYYSFEDFEPSDKDVFSMSYSDFGVDNSGQYGYETLCIDMVGSSLIPGWYQIEGYLKTEDGVVLSSTQADHFFDESTTSVILCFDGQVLGSLRYNGSYTVDVFFINQSRIVELKDAYTTDFYTYDGFEATYLINTTDTLYSTGGLHPVANKLGVTLETYSTVPRYVSVFAQLKDSTDEIIDEVTIRDIWAFENDSTLVLFDGGKIKDHGVDGLFTVDLWLYDEQEILLDRAQFVTEYYDFEVFSAIGLTGFYSDYGLDLDSNSFYDYLVIEAEVSVATPGYCTIEGTLEDDAGQSITTTQNTQWLPEGIQTLPLYFNGSEISAHGIDGSYTLSLVSIYHNKEVSLTDTQFNCYQSQTYFSADFDLTASTSPNLQPISIATGPSAGSIGESLQFNASASYDPEGSVLGYYWDFGDGATSDLQKPTHTYGDEGIYTVSLVVNDGLLDSTPDCFTLCIGYPVADAQGPYIAYGQVAVQFNASASYDPEGSVLGYYWDFGDGATSTSKNPMHTYSSYGEYTINLTVSDGTYSTSSSTSVSVMQSLLFGDSPVDSGLDINSDGLYDYLYFDVDVTNYLSQNISAEVSLTDCYGTLLSYGYETEFLNVCSYLFSVYFDGSSIRENMVDGPYHIGIVICDESDEILDQLSYFTQPYSYADFQYHTKIDTISDEGIDTNSNETYDYLSINVSLLNTISREITLAGSLLYSNGTVMQSIEQTSTIEGNTTIELLFGGPTLHTSEEDGPYTVLLVLKNQYANTIDSRDYLTSSYAYTDFEEPLPVNLPPIAEANGAYRANSSVDVQFNSTGSHDPEGQILTYLWDFGDGNSSTDANPVHAYNSTERVKFYPNLNVSDGVHFDTDTAVVYINYPVAISGGSYYTTEGVSVTLDGSASYDPLEEPGQSYPLEYYWYPANGDYGSWSISSKKYARYDNEGEYHPYLQVRTNTGYPWYYSENSYATVYVNDTDPIPDFISSQQSGLTPLIVEFTDLSDSYDGITLWEWDFDNDGIVDVSGSDAAAQNPSFTYTTAGVYSVNLTIHEADDDTVSIVKVDYITVVDTRPPITMYVPDDYPTIQEAIDAGTTLDGDNIVVRDGVFRQNIIVSKELTIKSENESDQCQLFPQYTDEHMILINSNNVTITGFSMNGTGYSYASLCCDGFENITITDNWINDTGNGIIFEDVIDARILNNSIENCSKNPLYGYRISNVSISGNSFSNGGDEGAEFSHMDNCTIKNNIAFGNKYSGVLIRSGNDNVLVENTLDGNGVPGHSSYEDCGLRILSGHNYLIFNNTMNNNSEYGLFLDASFNTVHQNNMKENGKYDFYACSDNTVTSNIGSGDKPIIYADESIILENMEISSLILYDADYSVVSNVTVLGSEVLKNNGIYAKKCDYMHFTNVSSNHNYFGIYMPSAKVGIVVLGQDNNTFTDCTFLNNSRAGIKTGGDGVKIENCKIGLNEDYGIDYHEHSEHSSIVNNTIYNNSWSGIHLEVDFTIFNITNNTLEGNSWGIYCSEGDYVGPTSSRVMISDNNVVNNRDDGIHVDDTNQEHYYKISNNTVNENHDSGLYLLVQYCTFDVLANQIIGNDEGICCENTYWDENAHVNITHNTILGNTQGISITKINDHPNNYYISENVISNNSQTGIYINPVSGNINILNNSILQNPTGISCINSYTSGVDSQVTIYSNILSENDDAIDISDICSKHDYDAVNNIINNNSMFGILLISVSGNMKIINNMISCNGEGIYSENSNTHANITHNIISNNEQLGINTNHSDIQFLMYNNIIVNNTVNDIGNSKWNISKRSGQNSIGKPYLGGNYWSGYDGVDNTGDYLGDTDVPHNSSRGIVNGGDYHPLVLSQELYLIPINDLTMFTDTIRFIPLCSVGNNTSTIALSSSSSLGFCIFTDQGNGIGTIGFQPADSDVGEYRISINATDGINAVTESFNLNVLPRDYLPVSSFTFEPEAPTTLDSIFFNSTSTDPDGSIVNWTWEMGDGSIYYGQNIQHSYIQGGTYQVSLSVKDNHGFSDNISRFIVVEAPYLDIGVNTIVSPQDAETIGSIPIEIEIENFGNTDENTIPLNVKISEITGESVTIFSENFSSVAAGDLPTGWTSTHTNWVVEDSDMAGGVAPELVFHWDPDSNDTFRVFTAPLNTTGFSVLNLSFDHYVYHYGTPYTLHVQTSTNGILWSDVWTIDPVSSIGPETIELLLTSSDGIGSDTLYVGWTFDGDSYNINEWYIDDIVLSTLPASINVYDETFYVDLSSGENLIVDSFSDWAVLSAGNYTIECFVNLVGDVNSLNNFIVKAIKINDTVSNQPPIADSGGPYTIIQGEDLNLDGSKSYDPDGTIIAYTWDLDNDGQYDDAVGQLPTMPSATTMIFWPTTGTYTITLKVEDEYAAFNTNTTTIQITIPNQPPTANAGGPYNGETGTSIAVDGSGSYDIDGTIVSYEWDFDNDGLYDDATGVSSTYIWDTDGSHTIYLRVTDDDGATDTDTSIVTTSTPNIPPVADAGGHYSVVQGTDLTLDGSGSHDPNDAIVSFKWDLDNDGQYDDATGQSPKISGVTVTSLWPTPGQYTIGLEVTDTYGEQDTNQTTVDIIKPNQLPIADAGGPYVGQTGSPITLDGSGSMDPDGTIVSYEWDLDNDGLYDDAFGVSPAYTWITDGTHIIKLKVTDNNGTVDSNQTTVFTSTPNLLPVADAGGPYNGVADESVSLDASGSYDSDGTIVSYEWDLDNDGLYDDAVGVSTTYSWSSAGVYTVRLKVTDDNGASDTNSTTVTINTVNQPPVAQDDFYSLVEDSMLQISEPGVLSNDYDPDGVSLSANLLSSVSHGALVFYDNGSFIYSPYANYSGSDSFSYTGDDGSLESMPAVVTFTINPINDAPQLAHINDYIISESETLTVDCTASDIDSDALSFDGYGVPSFGTFSDFTDGMGHFMFAPGFDDDGVYTIIINVTDGELNDSTQFSLTVENINRPPSQPYNPTPIDGSIVEAGSLCLSWTAEDPDDDSLSYDFFFGMTQNPVLIQSGLTQETYCSVDVEPAQQYYWQIRSIDTNGAATVGPIWDFTTSYTAELDVNKTVSSDGINWSQNLTVESGEGVFWNISVCNNGQSVLNDVLLLDSNGVSYGPFNLLSDEHRFFTYVTTVFEDYNNTVFASAVDCTGQLLEEESSAYVQIISDDTIDIELCKSATLEYVSSDDFEGFSHGFWKNHESEWVDYLPEDMTGEIFTIPQRLSVCNDTLHNALRFKGGKDIEKASKLLMVQSVAALLNSDHPNVSYPIKKSELINEVNSALASLDRKTMLNLKDTLDQYNNLGGDINDCPINSNCIIIYTIKILNNGTIEATGINVTDRLIDDLSFISATTTKGTYDKNTGLWTLDSIFPGENEILEITVETNKSGIYSNTAEVTNAYQTDYDSIPNNNIATEDDQDDVTIDVVLL